jgi:uncharacterized LabA/DUF88 family protein
MDKHLKQVAVFIDSQNVYMRARSIFRLNGKNHCEGQIDPLEAGLIIAKKINLACELSYIRIYRGIPSNKIDPKGYGAVRKQTSKWSASPQVETVLRPIHYPRNWPNSDIKLGLPREKGIDVALAVDFVGQAVEGKFDIGIIFSMDNDLKPALEYVGKNFPQINVGVASWWPDDVENEKSRPSTIQVPNIGLLNLRLNSSDYKVIHDSIDYSR